jgi:molybdopterin-guanine dinucleotide biosynthesis protein A
VRRAAVVLAGGRSDRMGRDKATLDWLGVPLVAHVAGVVGDALGPGPLVVVRSAGQALPPLPAGVEVVDDRAAGRGPLQGLRDGLEALAGRAEVAFACGVDAPLLVPAFVHRVVDAVGADVDAAIPVVAGRRHPLLAAYRVALGPLAAVLLDEGVRELGRLAGSCRARLLDERALLADPELAAADPELHSVVNVNTPEEYRRALALVRGPGPAGD